MTKRWTVPQMWKGETVAVLAPGPSLTQELADSVRGLRRIVVRRAFELAADADMLVSVDGPESKADPWFWDDALYFSGIKVCGTECPDLDAHYVPMPHEIVTIGPAHIVHIRNSGLAALRIAGKTGAARILLLGFEPEQRGIVGLREALDAIIAELQRKGVQVERNATVCI